MTDRLKDPEGATPLNPEELAGLKLKHVAKREQLDELEQANIQNGLLWLGRRKNRGKIFNEEFVRELHRQLFGDVWWWAGDFRTTEKNIGVAPYQISSELRKLLGDVSYWVEHKTFEPIVIAAQFHHRLVWVHPFTNGNGRHSRIMADVILIELLDAEAIDWSKGHDLQKMGDRRSEYIAALKMADAKDYRPLFEFVGKK